MPRSLPYSEKIESLMQLQYSNLPEKGRRHYAATEALKLGYGGISYISRVLGIERNTISVGIQELQSIEDTATINYKRQRKVGGGRKKKSIL